MNLGPRTHYSSMENSIKPESISQSAVAGDQKEILVESPLGYNEYEQGGETEEGGLPQYFQCESGEWMEVPTSAASNSLITLQLDESNDTVQYVNGEEYLVDGQQYVPLEEGEGQRIVIDDAEFQQLLASNQIQVIPDYEENVEMIQCEPILNGPFALDDGAMYFTFANGEVCGGEMVKEDTTDCVYVNPKQYERILKRREARRKLASRIEPRKKYIHPSRHAHALARKRGEGGKFGAGKPEKTFMKQELSNAKYMIDIITL